MTLAEGTVLEAANHGVRLSDKPARVWYVATDKASQAMREGRRVRIVGKAVQGPLSRDDLRFDGKPVVEVL